MTRWKATEREVASLTGGRRVPVSGRGRGDQPDIEHPRFSFEVKDRKELPRWLLDALAQAEAARRDGKTAVVVLHQRGQRHASNLVLLRLSDFLRLTEQEVERSSSE
jgi:hypothetical protein